MAFLVNIFILFAINAIIAVSLNLVMGYTGMLSVAQAAFFGIGAYAVALLGAAGWNFFPALLVGIAVAALLACVSGFIFARLSGDYYVLGTVALNYIVYSIFLSWEGLTNGALGVAGIARPELFGFDFSNSNRYLILCIVFLALVFWASSAIARSSFGRTLKAIREDEGAIQVFGYRTLFYKVIVFAAAAIAAAIAGSLYAPYLGYTDPTNFVVLNSIFFFAMVVIGGLANLKGSLFGVALLIFLPEFFRFLGFPSDIAAQIREVLYGLALVLFMIYRPQGIFGEYTL